MSIATFEPPASQADSAGPSCGPQAESERSGAGTGDKASGALAVATVAAAALNATWLIGALHPLRGPVVLSVGLTLPGWLILRASSGTGPAPRRRLRGGTVTSGEQWIWSVGLSVAVLMALGLTVNALPGRALTTAHLFTGLDLVMATLLAVCFGTRRRVARPVSRNPRLSGRDALALTPAALAVLAAVWGARSLDHGGSALAGMVAIALIGLTAVILCRSDSVPQGVATVALYLMGLAVVLMVSLRGSVIVGHDIKIEYRVFLDTLHAGRWQPGGFFGGYNSCLSITVLPVTLVRLAGISPQDVFRVVFPLLFAATVPLVYLIGRRIVQPWMAVGAAVLFLAFPTFVNDMAMIGRQEIALLFFLLAVLAVLDRNRGYIERRGLFLVVSAGGIVSHYSSTYVAVSLFALTGLAVVAVRRYGWKLRRPLVDAVPGHILTAGVIATLLVVTAGWGLATGTLQGVSSAAENTYGALAGTGGTRSGAVSYSLVSRAGTRSASNQLSSYLAQQRRANASAPAPTPNPGRCPVRVGAHQLTPITPVGRALAASGLAPRTLNSGLRLVTVLVFELGAVCGLALAVRRQTRGVGPPLEALLLAGSSLLALAMVVALPQLSVSYGLLRLYQQALAVLAPFVVIALTALVRPVGGRWTVAATTAVVVAVLLITTGFVPRLTGGYGAQLSLANAGDYYAAYYTDSAEVATAHWLDANLPTGAYIDADSAGFRDVIALTQHIPIEGLGPGLVPAPAYVLANEQGGMIHAVANYNDAVIGYDFPSSCLGGVRPVLFRQGDHVVFGPAR